MTNANDAITDAIRAKGFAFADADTVRPLLERHGSMGDWNHFAASWNTLAPDAYLAQTGRHRRRRFGVFSWAPDGALRREAHQPHYQSRAYNPLQGDIERWFEPLAADIAESASLRTILGFACGFFAPLAPDAASWRIEVHQFRIEARPGEPGEPTPEGVHRDGVDYVLVLMVDRENIASGTTTIHGPGGELLGSFTLTHSLDAALVDDARVFHGVTPVEPLDPALPAHRDVLVATFRRREKEQGNRAY